MQGLLDFIKTPEGQGLLAATFGGLAGARRGQPLNSLGRAGLAGIAGYASAQDQQAQQAERAFNQLQRARLQDEWKRDDSIRALAPKFFTPGAAEVPATPGTADVNNALPPEMQIGALPGRAAVPAQAPKFDLQGYGNALMGIDPIKGVAFQQALTKDSPFGKIDPKDYTPDSLRAFAASGGRDFTMLQPRVKAEIAPNGVAYNPFEVKPGATFANPNQPFNIGAGGEPVANVPFQQFALNKARASAANNNVTIKQEGEEAKKVGGFFGENYSDIQKAGLNAQGSLNRMERLGQLLDGVNTGKFAPLGVEVAKGAEALGFKVDPKLSNKEAAIALSSEMALQLRNPSGGAGMPGAMSDADRQFLVGMVPGIEKTPEGRQLILETGRKLAKRDMDVAKLARDYRKRNGSIDEGFYDELAKFSAANPLFAKPQAAQAPTDLAAAAAAELARRTAR